MGKYKTKKVMLFIVEGITDKTTLGLILYKIIENSEVSFYIANGDLTISGGPAQNAVNTVYRHVMNFIDRNRYNKHDIAQIVHLIDTDGAFIPDENVLYASSGGTKYFPDRIETTSYDSIIARNIRKTININRLSNTTNISGIPYRIYYFSRNLEHVLHNIQEEIPSRMKATMAEEFVDKYAENPSEFIDYINSKNFAVDGTYSETWEYIKKDINSLKRNSNFHLFFDSDYTDYGEFRL